MIRKVVFVTFILSFTLSGSLLASEIVVYPAEGQSNEQMDKDKYECYSWAKGQSGFDPMAPPTASTPPPVQPISLMPRQACKWGWVGTSAAWLE